MSKTNRFLFGKAAEKGRRAGTKRKARIPPLPPPLSSSSQPFPPLLRLGAVKPKESPESCGETGGIVIGRGRRRRHILVL